MLILWISLACAFAREVSRLQTFDAEMERVTFKVQSGGWLGTAFVLLEPIPGSTNLGSYVLVTAAHVLAGMPSSNMVVVGRTKRGNSYAKMPWEVPIRANGTNLWTQHPQADVAAMRIEIPTNLDIGCVSTERLVNDKQLGEFLIHPGDELRVLGYPLGVEANDFGFPILRSGRIASFPLIPTAETKTFLLDFRVFKGNSGGPVYMLDAKQMHEGMLDTMNVSCLMGLISEEKVMPEQVNTLTETTTKFHELGLGVVIHAAIIRETIARLPPYRWP